MILVIAAWFGVGVLFVLGAAGFILPIIPGVVFIIAALWLARRLLGRGQPVNDTEVDEN